MYGMISLYCLYLVMVRSDKRERPQGSYHRLSRSWNEIKGGGGIWIDRGKSQSGEWDDLQLAAPAGRAPRPSTDCWHCDIHGHGKIGLSQKMLYVKADAH